MELLVDFLSDYRHNFIEKIEVKDRRDDSTFSSPGLPFSEDHSAACKGLEDLSDKGIFHELAGLV